LRNLFAVPVGKFTASVFDIGGKFATSIVDTGNKFTTSVIARLFEENLK
jgi:hypothetical protein